MHWRFITHQEGRYEASASNLSAKLVLHPHEIERIGKHKRPIPVRIIQSG
jgi:hypothetical protein